MSVTALATALGHAPSSPATAQVRKEMQALSPEQAGEFLKAAGEDKWGVLLATGMRPEEYQSG